MLSMFWSGPNISSEIFEQNLRSDSSSKTMSIFLTPSILNETLDKQVFRYFWTYCVWVGGCVFAVGARFLRWR